MGGQLFTMAKPRSGARKARLTLRSPANELIVCFRELGALYKAGIPFSRALYVVSMQTEHPKLQGALLEALRNISSGWTISDALSIYPGLFPELYVRLIEVGETTGRLEQVLENISQHAEKGREKSMKLFSALAYPVFIIILCLGFLIIGPSFIFKEILHFLEDLHVSLPIATRVLILVSAVFRSPFFFISMCIFVPCLIFLFKRLWKARFFRGHIQNLILRIPGVGNLYRTSEIASAARTLATTCDSGLPILQGLDLTKRVVSLIELQDAIESVKEKVIDGDSLTEAFHKTGAFPAIMLQFLTAGEQTGDIGNMLNWAASMCEQNVEHSLTIVLDALQPVVILIVGIIVGFVIAATMGPMLKVAEGVM